jgi:biopolymer transport protein ExbB
MKTKAFFCVHKYKRKFLVNSTFHIYLHYINIIKNKQQNFKITQNMAEVKPAIAAAAKPKNSGSALINLAIVVVCLLAAIGIYTGVLGAKGNFGAPDHEDPKNLMGIMYKGGFLVPILIGTLLCVLVFIIERAITVFKAKGSMGNGEFIRKVQFNLANNNIDAAIAECDRQRGSVGNVMKAGILKYREMANASNLTQDQKLATIQKEVEEATSLELPMLEKNLVFLSTIASIATLIGLLGTVFGMIKSFQALGSSGAPDQSKLATGISEALINTALGIGTSMFAIIAYNYFTTIIDGITHGIDECGFTLSQSFKSKYPA